MHQRLVASSLLALSLASGAAWAEAPAAAKSFTLTVLAPAAKIGAAAGAKVEVKPMKGYHINKDYPTSLKITAPAGVDVPKPKLSKADGTVTETGAAFDVAFTAREAGTKSFTGTLSFAVCTDTTCDPQRLPVSFTVDVK